MAHGFTKQPPLDDDVTLGGDSSYVTPTQHAVKTFVTNAINLLTSVFAPISKGVTNGDSHDHSGGDGAQIPLAGMANVVYGTWTPTLTGVTNIGASTAGLCHYMRVGNEVYFHGSIQVDTTTTGAFTIRMSLPIASDFNATTDANGNGTQPGAGVPNIISIREDQTNNELQLDGYAQVNTNLFYRLSGGYVIK